MLKRLVASNYRSLGENVAVEFGRGITALVGANGAGKSNVLDALGFIGTVANGGTGGVQRAWGQVQAVPRVGGDDSGRFSIAVEVESDRGFGRWEISALVGSAFLVDRECAKWTTTAGDMKEFAFDGDRWKIEPPITELRHPRIDFALPAFGESLGMRDLLAPLRLIALYDVRASTMRVLRTKQEHRSVSGFMDPYGTDWAMVLEDRVLRGRRADLVAALDQIVGDIDDVQVSRADGSDVLVPLFHHAGRDRSVWLDASRESDGTLRAAGILTALLQQPAPAVIGIEEPELHLHPGALPVLMDFVREAADNGTQVVLTTQSPEVVDLLDVEDIRVVERVDGTTRVSPVAKQQRDAVKKRLLSTATAMRAGSLRADRVA